jgi:hypothetical protein
MVLMHGPFQFGLSEREVALLLDALDAASVSPPEGSEFRASEFAELSAELAERTAY